MKKLSLVICLILVLVMATPVSAARHEWYGDPLPMGEEFAEFPANTTTWINCFQDFTTNTYSRGGYDCNLEIDGQPVKESFKWSYRLSEAEKLTIWFWTFPEGLTGTHTFTLHVIEPCARALDEGLVTSCKTPKAGVEWLTIETTITFVE